MPSPSRKADWPIIAAVILALVVVALGVYVGMYYWRSRNFYFTVENSSLVAIREFNSKWEAALFQPAAKLETLLKGRPVQVEGPIIWTAGDLNEDQQVPMPP